ncbi:transposase, partial [Salinimicrobium catena]
MKNGTVRRTFSQEVKLDLVRKIEQGDLRVLDVVGTYGVSKTAVYKWLRKYSDLYKKETRVVVEHKSISKKNRELQDHIKKLEQALGQKQMRIDYLEKIVEFASE